MNAAINQPPILTLRLGQSDQADQLLELGADTVFRYNETVRARKVVTDDNVELY